MIFSESDDFSGASLANPWFPKKLKPKYHSGEVNIKDFSMIASNAVVMPCVTMQTGSVLGSFSLALDDIPEWKIYCGVPAKFVKPRQKDIIHLLDKFLANSDK